MQNDAINRILPEGKAVIPNVKTVLTFCRSQKLPIIYNLRIHRESGIDVEKFRLELFAEKKFFVEGTQGAEVVDELKPIDGELLLSKQRFSSFFHTNLKNMLDRLCIDTLVFTGIQTPNCIRGTVTDALAYDYNVVLVEDAICAKTEEVHRANMFDMCNMGAKSITIDRFINDFSRWRSFSDI